jgi:translation initiation factor eIF-2B subunit delta
MRPPLAFDSVSPQSPLLAAACDWLRGRLDAPEEGRPLDVRLATDAIALADAQPAMAALISVGTRVLAVSRKAALEETPAAEAKERIRAALAAWQLDFDAASEAVVRHAQELLGAGAWVATTTRSSLVERALLEAHARGRGVRVLLSESRPMNEGQGLARALALAGVPTWFAVDGALGLLLPQAGALWIGVDAVREKSLVVKAGTYGLLLVARELGVPAYAFAQRAKFLPDRCTRLTLPRRDAAEVWPDAPDGVQVVNLPFEEVPLALVRGVVTENGFLGPREIADAAGTTLVADELLAPAPLT